MTYKVYATEQGEFCIDWDACCRIITSYYRAQAQLAHAREVLESQSSALNPLSWGLPDLVSLQVDWDKVRSDSQANANGAGWRLAAVANFEKKGIDQLVRELKHMMAETHRMNASFQARLRQASAKSMGEIQRSVSGYQSWIDGAKLTRDLSGSVLIAAGTVATGGAAGVVGSGLGTVMKTTARYQDTGNLGSTAIELAQNLVFCVLPAARGVGLSKDEKVVKLLVSVSADTGKALLEGRSLGTALLEGAINVPLQMMGDPLKRALAPVLNKVAVPVLGKVLTASGDIVRQLPTEVGRKVIEDRGKKALQGAVRSATGGSSAATTASPMNAAARHRAELGDSVFYQDDLLLKFAIVDMQQGIGRSWW
jgi:hypothetical protein